MMAQWVLDITNGSGVFGGYVPNDVDADPRSIRSMWNANLYYDSGTHMNEDVVLDPFNLNILVDQVTISGTVTSCDGEPSDATYVVVEQADHTSSIVS